MSRPPHAREPGGYELRVDRHLDDHWAEWFGCLDLTREPDGTTTLRGELPDQAALHGLLSKVRDLGITLLSVRAVDRSADAVHPKGVHDPIDTTGTGATAVRPAKSRSAHDLHHRSPPLEPDDKEPAMPSPETTSPETPVPHHDTSDAGTTVEAAR